MKKSLKTISSKNKPILANKILIEVRVFLITLVQPVTFLLITIDPKTDGKKKQIYIISEINSGLF